MASQHIPSGCDVLMGAIPVHDGNILDKDGVVTVGDVL